VQVADDVTFEILGTADIREGDDYPGIRVNMKANYPPISVPLTVDVTTGDKITPREIEYTFSLMFDKRSIRVMATTPHRNGACGETRNRNIAWHCQHKAEGLLRHLHPLEATRR
jgi:hypothetical protein